jgi:nucleotidyltransferase substrate binding protein (TIGR01987 family)
MKNKTLLPQKQKFEESVKILQEALVYKKKAADNRIYYDAISKAFEVALEYGWKYLKARVEEEGIDVVSPKDAMRRAGEVGLIDNVEQWIGFLNARNLAVHDYLGIPSDDYLNIAAEFLLAAKETL